MVLILASNVYIISLGFDYCTTFDLRYLKLPKGAEMVHVYQSDPERILPQQLFSAKNAFIIQQASIRLLQSANFIITYENNQSINIDLRSQTPKRIQYLCRFYFALIILYTVHYPD